MKTIHNNDSMSNISFDNIIYNNGSMSNISFDNIIYNNISNIIYNITNHTNNDIDDSSSHKEYYHWVFIGIFGWFVLGLLLFLNRLINNNNEGETEQCNYCCNNTNNIGNNQYNENRCCNYNEKVKQKIINMLTICAYCSIFTSILYTSNIVSNIDNENNLEEDTENMDDSTLVEIQPKTKDNNNIIFKEKDLTTIINTKPNCTICLETINETNLIATQCDHYFCRGCVINHLNEDNRCPNCRQLIGSTLYKDSPV